MQYMRVYFCALPAVRRCGDALLRRAPQLSRPARTLLLGALQEAGGADWELRGPLAARLVELQAGAEAEARQQQQQHEQQQQALRPEA